MAMTTPASTCQSTAELVDESTTVPSQNNVPLPIRQQLFNPLRPWQIRMLRIQPSAEPNAPLVCELLVADLITFSGVGLVDEFSIVEYEALSYSWGHSTFTQTILCNNVMFPVAQALYDALQYLRESDKVRYLWCGACCIDQAEPIEKAAQVQHMFTIFQKAKRVVAWLGLPSIEADYLFQLVTLSCEWPAWNGWNKERAVLERSGENTYFFYQQSRALEAAQHLISTVPYFRRCWIRQEMEAAREVMVACGHYSVSLADFSSVLDRLLQDHRDAKSRSMTLADSHSRNFNRYTYFRDSRLSRPDAIDTTE